MRKVDKLGRIVIPMEMRNKYGLAEGAKVEFFDSGEGITVKPSAPFCRVCRVGILADVGIPLCEKCIAEAASIYNSK